MKQLAVAARRGPANGRRGRLGRTSAPGGWIGRRRGRVIVAVAALVLGIGSCQLPQPHLPKLVAGAAGGSTSAADRGGPVGAGRSG